jgi:hypothetical protein|tara:strand:+ start:159 stop:815 length:657 start_codon:yes stop_codon:yes gene_type:complete
MSGIQITTAPTQEPVTLQEFKEHLKLDDSTDERLLQFYLESARRFCEEYTKRSLAQQTITFFADAYDELADPLFEGFKTGPYLNYYKNYVVLPRPPVISVTSVSTFADDDTETTFASTRYFLDNAREPARVVLRQGESFPTALRVANAIKVVYSAGHSLISNIPAPLKVGILQHATFLYEHRGDQYEATTPYPPQLKSLYAPYVVHEGLGSSSILAIG